MHSMYPHRFPALGPLLAAAFTPDLTIRYITRAVRVNLMRDPLYVKALAVKEGIELNGNNITTDSYDSSVGPYNALTAGDKGDVATNSDVENAAMATPTSRESYRRGRREREKWVPTGW